MNTRACGNTTPHEWFSGPLVRKQLKHPLDRKKSIQYYTFKIEIHAERIPGKKLSKTLRYGYGEEIFF